MVLKTNDGLLSLKEIIVDIVVPLISACNYNTSYRYDLFLSTQSAVFSWQKQNRDKNGITFLDKKIYKIEWEINRKILIFSEYMHSIDV